MHHSKDLHSLNKIELKKFFNSFDVIFCDCDGVILLKQKVINGVPDAITALKNMNKKILYVTNNTSVTKNNMIQLLENAGIKIKNPDDIITPSIAIGSYLQKIKFTKEVFVIGLPGLRHDLAELGIQIANESYDSLENYTIECLQEKLNFRYDNVGAVIICLDFNMTLLSLNQAINYLQDPNVLFIITGTDKTICWTSGNQKTEICLGAGYIQNIAKDIIQRNPVGFGKPLKGFAEYLQEVMKSKNYEASRVLFIGDSLQQDITFARNLGMSQLLVLSGNTQSDNLLNCDKDQLPDYFIDGLSQLTMLINKAY